MSDLSHRALTSQFAEDLGWLEEHSRRRGYASSAGAQAEAAQQASELRLAAALVRNCLGPTLNGQGPIPLHVAVIGGAGAGKSTVANLLSGAQAAETNPQAGFTRHPIVYTPAGGPLPWTGHLGFLGPLQRAPQESPASLDADVYQVRRVPHDETSHDLLKDCVIWDCPDMTTWAAAGAGPPVAIPLSGPRPAPPVLVPGYITRLLEVAALADILVYVASDERYNDEIPTQFLHTLLLTNKPVVCVVTKMREADAEPLVKHFKGEVVKNLPPGIVEVLPIPFLNAEQLADPARRAMKWRIPLLNQIGVLAQNPPEARRRTLRGALRYLHANQERLMAVARQDVDALQSWRMAVQNGQVEFDSRYRREYLDSEKYRGFDEALVRLVNLLEVPGIGTVLHVVRTPYRLLKGLIGKALRRPEAPPLPEEPILRDALHGWIDALRREAAANASMHSLWTHVAQGFASGGLAELIQERFESGVRAFHLALADETERTARSIYEQLEKNPAALAALRGTKFALDAGAITGTILLGGIGLHDLVLVPLSAAVSQQLVEWLGKGYVEAKREQVRNRQQSLMAQYVSTPIASWLSEWPATGGSTFERLQIALRRIPESLRQLQGAVERAEQALRAQPQAAAAG